MSHLTQLKELLESEPFVPISNLRQWCNYRSRIDDLRKQGLDIRSTKQVNANGTKVNGYVLMKGE